MDYTGYLFRRANTLQWSLCHFLCDHLITDRSEHFGFDYRHEDDERVSAHVKHVRCLPRDAKEIY